MFSVTICEISANIIPNFGVFCPKLLCFIMNIQKRTKSILYSIFGIILLIIVIRMALLLINANESTPFVNFWYDFSNILIGPWRGIYNNLEFEGGSILEISSFIAIIFYFLLAFFLDNAITGIESSKGKNIFYSIINSLFKVVEFILGARFVFKLFAASTNSWFVDFIYSISNFIYRPFRGIVPDFTYENIVVELSTIIVLIIIILIDIGIDALLISIFEDKKDKIH